MCTHRGSAFIRPFVTTLLAVMILSPTTTLTAKERAYVTGIPSAFHVQTQIACEAEMLNSMNAREVFSGKAYEVLTEVARGYGRPIPHIYIFPGSWNMAYIASSMAVDGRGKIVVGQEAINRFHNQALKGFLGHEMAHAVSDGGAKGCNDYVVRDPQVEADADALAARILGVGPVEAFLEGVWALTKHQNSEAKYRLALLRKRSFKSPAISTINSRRLASAALPER